MDDKTLLNLIENYPNAGIIHLLVIINHLCGTKEIEMSYINRKFLIY